MLRLFLCKIYRIFVSKVNSRRRFRPLTCRVCSSVPRRSWLEAQHSGSIWVESREWELSNWPILCIGLTKYRP